jgi:hypothetical protein
MNAFFTIRNTYLVDDSIDNVSSMIAGLLDRRWYDFSENISGKLQDDGSFKLSPKWTLGFLSVFGMSQDMTYLIGQIKQEGNETIIATSTRPNYALVAAFYLPLVMLFIKAFGLDIFIQGTWPQLLLVIPMPCFVLAMIMVFSVFRLRNRFERLMQLERVG